VLRNRCSRGLTSAKKVQSQLLKCVKEMRSPTGPSRREINTVPRPFMIPRGGVAVYVWRSLSWNGCQITSEKENIPYSPFVRTKAAERSRDYGLFVLGVSYWHVPRPQDLASL
jgi:hypothetical protein